jgi:hypothetical protein
MGFNSYLFLTKNKKRYLKSLLHSYKYKTAITGMIPKANRTCLHSPHVADHRVKAEVASRAVRH